VKVGDLVKQAPNVWADREIGGKPMVVTAVRNVTWPQEEHLRPRTIVDVLVGGKIKTFHLGELEVVQ
jgi:hypothetical protein